MESIKLKNKLQNSKENLKNKKVLVGIDGYTDNIYRLIRTRKDASNFEVFEKIKDFSSFIDNGGLNSDIEITNIDTKFGGNGPILANALGNFNIGVDCIGTLGELKKDSIFLKMNSNCSLISIGCPGNTIAFEFGDGKLMFGDIEGFNHVNWNTFKTKAGILNLKKYAEESSLICITNLSQFVNIKDILGGMFGNVIVGLKDRNKYVFFDIADPSRKSSDDLKEILSLIMEYNRYTKAVLGLNLKEGAIIYKVLYGKEPYKLCPSFVAEKIMEKIQIDAVVVHSKEEVSASKGGKTFTEKCMKINYPKVLTGSGDNFNAGFCLGLVLDFEIDECIKCGIASASSYITNGKSSNIDGLLNFIDGEV